MGTLLLCSHGLASAPYYLESMALNIYSIEELCYYLKQNIDLVEPSFMDEELIDWIRIGNCGKLQLLYKGRNRTNAKSADRF